jgi:hypothetical protein
LCTAAAGKGKINAVVASDAADGGAEDDASGGPGSRPLAETEIAGRKELLLAVVE